MEWAHELEIHAIDIPAVPCCLISMCILDALWAECSREPMMHGSVTQREYKGCVLYAQLSEQGHRQPWQATLSIQTRTCLECRKRAAVLEETQTTKETCHAFSYSCLFAVLAEHLHRKWWHRRKGEDRAATGPFCFSSSLPISKAKAESVGRMWFYPGGK